MTDLTTLLWVVSPGSSIIRAENGASPGGSLVGAMETPEIAAAVVLEHNEALTRKAASRRGVNLSGSTGVQIGDGNTQIGHFY